MSQLEIIRPLQGYINCMMIDDEWQCKPYFTQNLSEPIDFISDYDIFRTTQFLVIESCFTETEIKIINDFKGILEIAKKNVLEKITKCCWMSHRICCESDDISDDELVNIVDDDVSPNVADCIYLKNYTTMQHRSTATIKPLFPEEIENFMDNGGDEDYYGICICDHFEQHFKNVPVEIRFIFDGVTWFLLAHA